MEYQKFINLANEIRLNYNFLPKDIRRELNDVLIYYKDLSIIAKVKGD